MTTYEESFSMTILLNGLALSALLMLLSSGLALMYGMRGIMNFAHGALYMLGAYVAYSVAEVSSFWLALIVSPLLLGMFGAFAERFGFRFLVGRDLLEVGLVTLGGSLMIQSIVITVWGPQDLSVSVPKILDGTTRVLGEDYPSYRLFLIVVAAAVMFGLWAWLSRSRTGLFIRAASVDRETTAMMGVNVDRIGTLVVAVSMALAGVAGTLASAYLSVSPGMGVQILVPALMVIVIGGLGSIGGAALAALVLGVLEAFAGAAFSPSTAAFFPYVALILVLMFRPVGLFGQRAL
jgi:branched-chain amino acid transport system permease protein